MKEENCGYQCESKQAEDVFWEKMCMGMHVNFKAGPPIFVFMKLALVKDIRLLKEGKSYIAPTLDVLP